MHFIFSNFQNLFHKVLSGCLFAGIFLVVWSFECYLCVGFDTKPDSSLENWEWPWKDFKQNVSFKLELGGKFQLFHGNHQKRSCCIHIDLCSRTSRLFSSHWRREEGVSSNSSYIRTMTDIFIFDRHHERAPLVNQFIKWWTIKIEEHWWHPSVLCFPGRKWQGLDVDKLHFYPRFQCKGSPQVPIL